MIHPNFRSENITMQCLLKLMKWLDKWSKLYQQINEKIQLYYSHQIMVI